MAPSMLTVEQRPGLATVTPYQGLPSLHLAHNASEVRKAGRLVPEL